jgi:hypothetical protein
MDQFPLNVLYMHQGSRKEGSHPVTAVHYLLQANFLKPFEVKI